MKQINIFTALLFAFFLLSTSSCKKDNPEEPNFDVVSQYELDKAIVRISATNIATGLETLFVDEITDSVERAHLTQAFVMPVRFFNDQSGYFFVETFGTWVVAHPTKPELIGTYRMEVQDPFGKYYIKEIVSTVTYIGYGFVEYYFENPATGQLNRKLTFVKSIPSAEWFIGAGFYGDPESVYYEKNDANKIIVEEATRIMATGIGGVFAEIYSDSLERVSLCRKFIDHIRFFDDQSGYFFIYDFNCINVAHGVQKEIQGENLYNYQDSHGNYVIRDLGYIAANEGSGFYQYYWNNPVTGLEEAKIAYVERIPGTDYYVGSGFYLN